MIGEEPEIVRRLAGIGKLRHDRDAETTPLREPERSLYDFDPADKILSATRFAFGGHLEKK